MRRWLVVAGALLAVGAVLSALRADGGTQFDAEAAMRVGPSTSSFQPVDPALLREQLRRPEVTELVRQRLGYLPSIQLDAGWDGVIVVRARASTAESAARAAATYAAAFLDVRGEDARRELGAAGAEIRRHLDRLDVQIVEADGARRDALLSQRSLLGERLNQLTHESTGTNAEIIRSAPGTSTADRTPRAWFVAALGLLVVGAQLRRRPSGEAVPTR